MENTKLILNIEGNLGYSADQVGKHYCMTVGELKRILEDYDNETPIITNNENNQYGAAWGELKSTDEYKEESENCCVNVYVNGDLVETIRVDENDTDEDIDKIVREGYGEDATWEDL